ncbi:MAG: glycosyltransferase family 2 protein [Proteobacteria bacterium]|nr:glycosyltransferase family 2 protein [Pseudomonadota bacterium]MBU3932529.1 glycosyltransferase family 2 protein [Pseudomonadota bacterium]MBU4074727.1 glycosyltransferase family 2 protein [Pseudomonadota bacterium]
MNLSPRTQKYLHTYGVSPVRPLLTASVDGVERAVVIPALAESSSLFRTLASIAGNSPRELRRTLVICVVNNHRPHLAAEADILDNRETLNVFNALVLGRPPSLSRHTGMLDDIRQIARSGLRLACIDASSPGLEIPDRDGGVGTARKIGMDAALKLLDSQGTGGGVICCLDADTLVDENYLSAVGHHFAETGNPAAVSAYAHQKPSDPEILLAICGYEIFLRSYVIGLSFAGSPYAFHSIGSTMACTAESYVGVRGMNRRAAAEDFYFLNKLCKIGKIGVVRETTVFPSSRPSGRAPFGTGRRVLRFMTGGGDECRLYDPRVFDILREWLAGMEADPDRDPGAILVAAGRIHFLLEEYLRMSRFDRNWRVIRRNCSNSTHLRRQFHVWFDGLKTLRLIHHLSRSAFPPVPIFDGLKGLLDRVGGSIPIPANSPEGTLELDLQFRILEELRSQFPCS